MKFKELEESTINQAREIYKNKELSWDGRMNKLIDLFGQSERTCRKWCVKLGFKERPEIVPEQEKLAKLKEHDKTKRYYLITSAQNATNINSRAWKSLQAYSEFLDAEILVIPFRYRNPTSVNTNMDDDWWNPELVPYLTLNRHNLNNSISVLADVKIQPTAFNPMLGLESMTGNHTCVVGHPKMELKTVPVLDEYKPKFILTTGCITKPNFSDTKAGKRGHFHFSTGFCIVEIKDDETYFFRQVGIKEDTGEFIDLFYHVKDGIVNRIDSVDAVIMGDIHVKNVDNNVIDKTFNDLFKKLYPKKLFIHDIMDSVSVSHHTTNDPFIQYQLEINNENSLQKELDEMIVWLKQIEQYDTYIVKSNHDEHIDRFIRESNLKNIKTPKNYLSYIELCGVMLRGEAPNGIVPYYINKFYPNFKCLTYNDSIVVNGYLCSIHGNLGVSGTRGSIAQFSKLILKTATAHSHSIFRMSGSCSVGTSTKLRFDYNKGLTTWVNAHGTINKLGKFQHIIFFHTKDGIEFTTFE